MLPTLGSDNDTHPRFEFYPENSPTLRTVHAQKFPFNLGRGESAQLQINSTLVSREHAQLTKTASGYRLRDLGSTNGTAINGEPITDSPLRDGDAVSIADIELTFACSSMGRLQRIVTQPLAGKRKLASAAEIHRQLADVRELNETLLWQTILQRWATIVDLHAEVKRAMVVSSDEPLSSQLQSAVAHDNWTPAARIQFLAWQLAVEQSLAMDQGTSLLLRLELPSLLDEGLITTFGRLQRRLVVSRVLGVVVSWEWVSNTPSPQRVFADLQSRGTVIALDHFAGGPRCIEALKLVKPDYLMFDPRLICGITSQTRRLQQLEILQATCDDDGICPVLPSGLLHEDYHACFQIGFRHVLCARTPEKRARDLTPAGAIA